MRNPLLVGALFIMISAGCTSITVTKVDPQKNIGSRESGQRFSLPRPYIQVTPQTDGSITADIIYLPDPDHTYAIDSWAFIASNSLEVAVDGGIIKSVNWTGDSSAALQAAVTSAGNVASGIIQAEQKKETDQHAKEETAAKAVSDAQLALDQAHAQLAIVLSTPNASANDVLKAKYAVSDGALKLQALKNALAKIRGGLAVADKPSPVNTVFGPKLFAIQEQVLANNQTRLKIVTVKQTNLEENWNENQPKYQVTRPPAPPPDKTVELFPKGIKSVHPDKDGNMLLTLQLSKPISNIISKSANGKPKTYIKNSRTQEQFDVPVALDAPTLITVDLKSLKNKPGAYTLTLAVQIKQSDSKEEDASPIVDIVIAR